jgi:ubiquitin-protein ligase E3 A
MGCSYEYVQIRRECVREDALEQIVRSPQDLKKPLRVKFVSEGVEEEAVDEGGVTKEFFQLLVREIFDADFGMFTYNEETRQFWCVYAAAAAAVPPFW